MTIALAPTEKNGRAIDVRREPSPIDSYRPLDQFDTGLVEQSPRLDAIATISAGYRKKNPDGTRGLPQRSTGGEIYLHDAQGLAPGLAAALKETEGQNLTIAFPSDDPELFIQARYVRYSSTALEAYGDQFSITVLIPGPRRLLLAGTKEYDAERAKMKVSASIYFMLAAWEDGGPVVVFPDGVGYYRLRTGKNSLRNLDAALKGISRYTGAIAGLPFRAAIDYRDFSDGAGKRNNAPVWTFVPGAGNELQLTSRTWRAFAQGGLAEGQALMLPAPTVETIEHELAEPSEPDVEILNRGGLCDFRYYNRFWHAVVKGTPLAEKVNRAWWFDEFTHGECLSLAEYLSEATEAEAAALIVAVQDTLARFPDWPEGVDEEKFGDEAGTADAVVDGAQERRARALIAADAAIDREDAAANDGQTDLSEVSPAPILPSSADYSRWVALSERAIGLDLDPEQFTAWELDPTRDQLRASYNELRAACIERRTLNATEALLDGVAPQETPTSVVPAFSAERRKGLLNEHKVLRVRGKDLGITMAAPLSEDIGDAELLVAVAALRARVDAAANVEQPVAAF